MAAFPDSDAAFNIWQADTITYINAHLGALGLLLGDPDVTAMNTAQAAWATGYPAALTAQAAAQSANTTKDAERHALEAPLRRISNRAHANSTVLPASLAAAGFDVHDTVRTPVGAPTSKPVLQPDTSHRLRVVINFSDEGTPTSRAKPAGVIGMELWVKLGGPPPTDLSECTFLALDTRTPYSADFDGSEANQTAHFIGRWVSTRGEKGPLSETASATIPA